VADLLDEFNSMRAIGRLADVLERALGYRLPFELVSDLVSVTGAVSVPD
jgi:hypothetical protein